MREIKLTKGFSAWVDDEDYERAITFKWYASIESRGTKVYAIRWARREEKVALGLDPARKVKIRLHRWLLGLPPLPGINEEIVDHDNEDGLDCTRANLILRSQAENMQKVDGWRKKGQRVRREPWL